MYALYIEYPKWKGSSVFNKGFYHLGSDSFVGSIRECEVKKKNLEESYPGFYTELTVVKITPVTKK